MKTSLYEQYLKEREEASMIHHEWGFAIYKMAPDHVYLQDIFVIEKERKNGRGVQLMNEVSIIGSELGVHKMIGSVAPSTPFGGQMLKIMLELNFKLLSAEHDMIYLIREI